jgi:hypothetical protein
MGYDDMMATLDGSLQGTGGCVHSVRIHRLEQHRYQVGPRYDPSTVQHSMEGDGEVSQSIA